MCSGIKFVESIRKIEKYTFTACDIYDSIRRSGTFMHMPIYIVTDILKSLMTVGNLYKLSEEALNFYTVKEEKQIL